MVQIMQAPSENNNRGYLKFMGSLKINCEIEFQKLDYKTSNQIEKNYKV